jgi:Protein of unknown function (DUF2530)
MCVRLHGALLSALVARPYHPAPPPLKVDTVRVVLAGSALWAVALAVLLLLGDRVDPVWAWTCVAGIALAVIGLGVMKWQGQLDKADNDDRGGGKDRY